MHSALPHVSMVTSAMIVALGSIGVSAGNAQTLVTSPEELRRQLAIGDFITVAPVVGRPVAGRLIRIGDVELEVRLVAKPTQQEPGQRDVTLELDAIQSLERQRDPTRNGAARGAGIGAGLGGAMFVHALVIDRNEVDEWAAFYGGAAAVCTGIGALIGWAIDRAISKPHIRFAAAPEKRTRVGVQPVFSRGGGIALAVSVSP